MPILKIVTNVPKSKIPMDFVDKIIPVLADCVKKEPKKFVCTIAGDTPVSFGGASGGAGAVATLESIGNVGEADNQRIVNTLSVFLERELGVTRDRFILSIYDLKPWNIGRSSVTADKQN